jgi:hypothetical protein
MLKRIGVIMSVAACLAVAVSCSTTMPLDRGSYSRATVKSVVISVDPRREQRQGFNLAISKIDDPDRVEADKESIFDVAGLICGALVDADIAAGPSGKPECAVPARTSIMEQKVLSANFPVERAADAFIEANIRVRFGESGSSSFTVLGVGVAQKTLKPYLSLSLRMVSASTGKVIWRGRSEVSGGGKAAVKSASIHGVDVAVNDPAMDVDYLGLTERALEMILGKLEA